MLNWVRNYRTFIEYTETNDWVLLPNYRNTVSDTIVPKLLHQTYHSKHSIPVKINANFAKYASKFERRVYDDSDIADFLDLYYEPQVLARFNSLKVGPHKADLFRYCVLYIHGGIYMDIKTELVKDLEGLFPDDTVSTVIANDGNTIFQGIIACPPRQPIFLALIAGILRASEDPPYHLFTLEFMRYIRHDVRRKPNEGRNQGTKHAYMLFREKCAKNTALCSDGLDRYGMCCNVTLGGERVIKTRYADYPW
jgi:hypothetical protein